MFESNGTGVLNRLLIRMKKVLQNSLGQWCVSENPPRKIDLKATIFPETLKAVKRVTIMIYRVTYYSEHSET